MTAPDKKTSAAAHRFARALATYSKEASVQREMAETLVRELGPLPKGIRVLEPGCGTGILTELLRKNIDFSLLVRNDLVPECEGVLRERETFLAGDAEEIDFPGGPFGLIASNAVFQWMRNPEAFFRKLAELLEPGRGILAYTSFLPGNLEELSELGRGLSYPGLKETETLLKRDFRIRLLRAEPERKLIFPDVRSLLEHLRRTGVTATAGTHAIRGKKDLEEFIRQFSERHPEASLTYRPVTVIAERND